MSVYDQIAWLPLCGGLTGLGAVASWIAWRRRGYAAGLRGLAWSLLPLVAYLVGAIEAVWKIGSALATFASSFVFSPRVWSGVILLIVSLVLFVVSGTLRRRRRSKQPGAGGTGKAVAKPGGTTPLPATSAGASQASVTAGKAAKGKRGGDGDDFSEVEEILRRHGIK